MAANFGGPELLTEHFCQPTSGAPNSSKKKKSHHTVKMVQLYLTIQNVSATFYSHAWNIKRVQGTVQGCAAGTPPNECHLALPVKSH